MENYKKESIINDQPDAVPLWEKANLTIPEAAAYFNIGQNRHVKLCCRPNCNFVLHIGNKRLIKRKAFEAFLEDQRYL